MEKLGTLYGLAVVQDYEPLAPAAYHEFLRPLGDVNTDRPLFWGRFFPGPGHPAWRLLDALFIATFATWAVWAAYLVARARGLTGRRAAYLALAGFALVIVVRLALPAAHFA